MTNHDNQNNYQIYYRPLHKWIEVTQEEKQNWERFTDAVVDAVSTHCHGVVYMLWGSYAQKKAARVDSSQNLILRAVHPSPLSAYRGFFGCRHFSQANAYLQSLGKTPIIW